MATWKRLPLSGFKAVGSRREKAVGEQSRAEGHGPNSFIPVLTLAQEAGDSLDKLGQD